MRRVVLALLLLASLASAPASGGPPGDGAATLARSARFPRALVLADGGRLLLTANGRAGTVSIVDTAEHRVLGEVPVGEDVTHLALAARGIVLAVDAALHELVVLDRDGASLRAAARLRVSSYPVSVLPLAGGERVAVASLWSRRVTFVRLLAGVRLPAGGGERAVIEAQIEMPFAPRSLVAVTAPGGSERLLAADAFGGNLAVLHAGSGAVESVRAIDAHNVRGLAAAPGREGEIVLIAHQRLRPAPTTLENVREGRVVTNGITRLALAALLAPERDLAAESLFTALGEPGRGAGDPADIAVSARGDVLVALGGVGEVAIGSLAALEEPALDEPALEGSRDAASAREDGGRPSWRRVRVGRRPAALAVPPSGSTIWVANTFGGSVSAVDPAAGEARAEVSLGPAPEPSLVERGERLFHDARLSRDGWFSCHSCHTDGHTNDLLADTLGDGGFGAPKRVLTLHGTADTGPWAWNGQSPYLDVQLATTVERTMRGEVPGSSDLNALAAFLRALAPAPGLLGARGGAAGGGDGAAAAALERGRVVFALRGCARCHDPQDDYTSPAAYDVGLEDESGRRRFNPPSLRGVSQRGRFFHDGRARSLEEALLRDGHPRGPDGGDGVPEGERADLLRFLESL